MAKRGVNKAIILGNLGNDPEVKTMASGDAVASLSVATSEAWKDKQTGEKKERTEWHRVSLFGKLAEIAGKYLKKGSKVYIEGELRTRKWQDQNGVDRYTTEIIVGMGGVMQMLDSASGASNDPAQHASGNRAQANPAYQQPQQSPSAPAGNFDDFDDQIPF